MGAFEGSTWNSLNIAYARFRAGPKEIRVYVFPTGRDGRR